MGPLMGLFFIGFQMQLTLTTRPFTGQTHFKLPVHDQTATVTVNGVNATIESQDPNSVTLANPVASTDTVAITFNTVPLPSTGSISVLISGSFVVGQTLTAVVPNGQTASFQWMANGVAISGATNQTYVIQSGDAGKKITVKATAFTVESDGQSVPVPPVTITTFPYTLQVSDNGGTLNLAPTAEAVINVPTGLGASFAVNLIPITDYPIKVVEVGTSITDTAGYRLSNAQGRGRNMLLAKNRTAVLMATSANTFSFSGAIGKWQQFANHTHYPGDKTVSASNIVQQMARTHHMAKGTSGDTIVGLKVAYTNVYGITEAAIANDISVAGAIEYPVGTTPPAANQIKFSGVATGTMPSGVKTLLMSDYIKLDTPIPLTQAGTLFKVRSWLACGAGGSLPSCTGKEWSEYYNYTTTVGSTLNNTMAASSVLDTPVNSIQGTSLNSSQVVGPVLLIGVTNTGATILVGDSRSQPSNGDWPTDSKLYSGELERIWDRNGPTLNLSSFGDQMGAYPQSTNSALRRSLYQYGENIAMGLGINDMPAGSVSSWEGRVTTVRALTEFTGRKVYWNTMSPNTSSSDYWTSSANQTFANESYRALRDALNAKARAGLMTVFDGYTDGSKWVEDPTNSDKWTVSPYARSVTDAAITSGTNTLTSATANFTSADTGLFITGPWGASGATVTAVMNYVNSTTVTLTGNKSRAAYNASTTVSGATAYIQSHYATTDGLHGSKKSGELMEASVVVPSTM